MTEPCIEYGFENGRIGAELRQAESQLRANIRALVSERDSLLAAVELVVDNTLSGLRAYCEDHGIDTSIEMPSKMEVLRHALTRIRAERLRRFPPPPAPRSQSLPVSDIPLDFTDP